MLSQGSARSRRARQREMGHQGVLPQVGRPTVVVTGGVDALIQAGVARGGRRQDPGSVIESRQDTLAEE